MTRCGESGMASSRGIYRSASWATAGLFPVIQKTSSNSAMTSATACSVPHPVASRSSVEPCGSIVGFVQRINGKALAARRRQILKGLVGSEEQS